MLMRALRELGFKKNYAGKCCRASSAPLKHCFVLLAQGLRPIKTPTAAGWETKDNGCEQGCYLFTAAVPRCRPPVIVKLRSRAYVALKEREFSCQLQFIYVGTGENP